MDNYGSIVQLNAYPRDKFNVLVPVTTMQAASNLQRIMVNTVQLNPDAKDGKDIYLDKTSSEYAITKVGGMKLAAAANISIVDTASGRTEGCLRCIDMARATGKARVCGDCPHMNDVAVTVTIRVPEPSGGFRLMKATKEIDCTIDKTGMTDAQYKRFLPHRTAMAESKAFMRAIRAALGLAGTYKLPEIQKPFIVAHIVPNIDAPEIREAVANNYLQSMGMLFETPVERAALPPAQQPVPEIVPEFDDEDSTPLPWENPEPDGFEPEPEGTPCSDCGQIITETMGTNGQHWTVDAIVGYSTKRFSRALCTECQHRAKNSR